MKVYVVLRHPDYDDKEDGAGIEGAFVEQWWAKELAGRVRRTTTGHVEVIETDLEQ